jgi:hypothetical protein
MTVAWGPGGDFGSPTYTLPIQVVDGEPSLPPTTSLDLPILTCQTCP